MKKNNAAVVLGWPAGAGFVPRWVFWREPAAGAKPRLQCQGSLVELVCTVTPDSDCPIVGDLLFWLVMN